MSGRDFLFVYFVIMYCSAERAVQLLGEGLAECFVVSGCLILYCTAVDESDVCGGREGKEMAGGLKIFYRCLGIPLVHHSRPDEYDPEKIG